MATADPLLPMAKGSGGTLNAMLIDVEQSIEKTNMLRIGAVMSIGKTRLVEIKEPDSSQTRLAQLELAQLWWEVGRKGCFVPW